MTRLGKIVREWVSPRQIVVGVAITVIGGLSLWAIQGRADEVGELSKKVAVHESQIADNARDHDEMKDTLREMNRKLDRILERESGRRE